MHITCTHCEHHYQKGYKTCKICGFYFDRRFSFNGLTLLGHLKAIKTSLEATGGIPELAEAHKVELEALTKSVDKLLELLAAK